MTLSAEDRVWLASKGICVACGKREAMPEKSICSVCRERQIEKYYRKKSPTGDGKTCPACGKHPREFAQSRCSVCLSEKAAAKAEAEDKKTRDNTDRDNKRSQ